MLHQVVAWKRTRVIPRWIDLLVLINRASDGSGVCHHCQLVLGQPGCHQIFVIRVGLDTHV